MGHFKVLFEDMSEIQKAYTDMDANMADSNPYGAMRALKRFRNLSFIEGTGGGITRAVRRAMVAWEYHQSEENMLKIGLEIGKMEGGQ